MTLDTLSSPTTEPTAPRAQGSRTRVQRRWLHIDAAASLVMGVGLVAGSSVLDRVLGIGSGWLLGIGVFCVLYAIDLVLVARKLPRSERLIGVFAIGNAGWVLASIAVLLLGAWELTATGVAVVLAQAAAVAVFAVEQRQSLQAD